MGASGGVSHIDSQPFVIDRRCKLGPEASYFRKETATDLGNLPLKNAKTPFYKPEIF
jgi:hypothetical protein